MFMGVPTMYSHLLTWQDRHMDPQQQAAAAAAVRRVRAGQGQGQGLQDAGGQRLEWVLGTRGDPGLRGVCLLWVKATPEVLRTRPADVASRDLPVWPRGPTLKLRLTVSGSAACPGPIMQRWEELSGKQAGHAPSGPPLVMAIGHCRARQPTCAHDPSPMLTASRPTLTAHALLPHLLAPSRAGGPAVACPVPRAPDSHPPTHARTSPTHTPAHPYPTLSCPIPPRPH